MSRLKNKLFKTFNVDSKQDLWKLLIQFIKFGIVGLSNTLISLGVYYLLVPFGVDPLLANTAGFLVSVINAFYWNYKYVFVDKKEKNPKKAFVKLFVTYGISYLVSTLLIYLLIDIFGVNKYIAPLLRLVVTVPLNFVLNKLWAFKDDGGKHNNENKGL